MTALPASVRVAVWATAAWRADAPFDSVRAAALPDLDVVTGLAEILEVWRALGEQAVLCALPRPGDTAALAGSPPDTVSEVVDAGECVRAPALGAVAVPGFLGSRAHWRSLDGGVVPRHRVEMLDPRELRRTLAEAVAETTEALEQVGGRPFRAHPHSSPQQWGLPPDLGPVTREVVVLAASVGEAAYAGLALSGDAPTQHTYAARTAALHRLAALADRVLADAANAAVAQLAGWAPTR